MSSDKYPTRTEIDSMGAVEVPLDKYWGAQTQRSLHNFNIGAQTMPIEVIHAMGIVKQACAKANHTLGKLTEQKFKLIEQASQEVIEGTLDDHFPLKVWQTGSGTQTNMNINEVIANRANELAGEKLGSKQPIHPNDDVNLSQSSNDTFPTAMHISSQILICNKLIPKITSLQQSLTNKQQEFIDIIKIGRTHLQDAVPLTLGQEFSSYVYQVQQGLQHLVNCKDYLFELAIGGTAVGSGINAPKEFAEIAAKKIAEITALPFVSSPNKFAALACHDPIVQTSSTIKNLAILLIKIANDIRWLGSGPRCGIGELILPANEPGSSIMPGKVNPTQCEAITMVCTHIIGNDTAISIAGSQGNFQLNVYKPMIICNFIESISLLADSINSFNEFCITGIAANQHRIDKHLNDSLMLATALTPHIGYDKATEIAKKALAENLTLREASNQLNYLTHEQFDQIVQPSSMIINK